MPDDTHDVTPQDDSLDGLLAEYVAGEDAGQPQDRQAILARYPRHAAELREFFANRDQMRRLAAPLRGVEAASSNHASGRSLGKLRYFGDYELLEEIAAGGMGIVYKARQVSLSRIVAVKMMLKGTLATEDDVKRFRAEAEAAASLQHPAIVAIHEVGLHEGQHYFSMDFVDGSSLAELPREHPLSARQAGEYLRDAAEAVHYAHAQGTLHRDLKPSNILIDGHGRVRITDFGLAKKIAGNSDLTLTGQILGTPSYMPPEQALGKRSLVAAASDIYSLGAVLYELLAGRPPFRGESPAETLRQVETLDPVAPRLLNPVTPRDLETICLKCLEKEPHKRYGTAQLLADDLGRFLRGEPIVARPVSRPARAWRWCRRNPMVAGLSAAVALLVGTVTIVATAASFSLKQQRDTVAQQNSAIEKQTEVIQSESNRAHAAEQTAKQRLYQSLLNQARASRFSRRAGQRLDGLKAIEEAAALSRLLDLGPEATQTLRDEYMACLALFDLQSEREWEIPPITDWGNVAFDDSLTRYVVQNPDRTQSIRRVEDGVELVAMPGGMGRAILQKFSPDGRWLASIFSTGRFVLWNASTGDKQGTIDDVRDFSISPDSQVAALSCGTHIETRRLDTWAPGHSLTLANVERVALHPDGDRIAATVGNAVEIWSLKSAQRQMRLPLPAKPSQMVAWRPDGELLAVACADYCIYVWDLARGRQRVALRGHDNAGIRVVFSPDGSVLASHAWDGTTRLWDPVLGRELVRIDGLVRQFSRDGRRLAYDDGARRVGIWRLAGNEERRTLGAFHTRQGTRVTTGVAINRAGNLMAASGGDGVFVWEIPAGRLLGRLPWGFTGSVQFDFQDRLVVPAGNTVRLASLNPTSTNLDDMDGITSGTFADILANAMLSADGRIALAKESPHTIAVFSLAQQERAIVRMKHNGVSHTATGLALSPDGHYAATMGFRGVGLKLWDTSSGRLIDDLWPETAGGSVAFSPDGQWIAATSKSELRVWTVAGWQLTARIPRVGQGNANGPIAFSPDGRMLAAGMSRSGVQLIDPLNWDRLTTIEPINSSYEVKALAFTPNSGILAICYIDAVDIWDLALVRERLSSIGLDW